VGLPAGMSFAEAVAPLREGGQASPAAWLHSARPHQTKAPLVSGAKLVMLPYRACRSLRRDSKPTTPTPSRTIGCTHSGGETSRHGKQTAKPHTQ
jgi:hypothetical protein